MCPGPQPFQWVNIWKKETVVLSRAKLLVTVLFPSNSVAPYKTHKENGKLVFKTASSLFSVSDLSLCKGFSVTLSFVYLYQNMTLISDE